MTTRMTGLEKIAQRARSHPAYLAYVFAEYQQHNHLDDHSMATLLGCPPELLPSLALCLRPAPSAENFGDTVAAIARNFALDAGRLAAIIRQVDIFNTLQEEQPTASVSDRKLRAARDFDAPSGEEG